MSPRIRPHPVAATLAVVLAMAWPAPPTAADTDAADRALAELLEAEWDYQMEHNPVWASLLGDRRFNDRWDDRSLEAIARDRAHNAATLAKLDAIGRERLSMERRLDWDLLRHDLEHWIREDDLEWYLMPWSHLGWLPEGFRQRTPLHVASQLATQLRFETVLDYEDWIARLRAFPRYAAQTLALVRRGLEAGFSRPRVILERLPPVIAEQAGAAVEASGFYTPFLNFPDSVPQAERPRLAAAGAKAVAEDVLPALRAAHAFLVDDYLPAASVAVAVGQLPRGGELYEHFVRRFTTTEMTSDEIHRLGLAEVERIRGEMEEIWRGVGFDGTLRQFFDHLRTAPQFFYQDPDELLTAYRALTKRVDPLMVRLFGTLPRMPYGVEPFPAAIAPHATTGFYFPAAGDGSRAGTYQVNLYRPETRPRWEMVPLTLHEAVPGHHLQVSLAAELGELSDFRRHNYHSAFGEGWGLYAEWLGYELGLYEDPYDRFGQLAFEMWRAVRLVVDTGMHAKGWSRRRAIEFFLESSPRPEFDVVNEIDRYIAMPGQALSYKIGQLKIRQLRERATDRLGDRFDLRAFHDLVLGAGSLPLTLLEERVEAWIAGRLAAEP